MITSYTLSALHCRILLLVLLLTCWLPAIAHAAKVEVVVRGVAGEQLKNVMSRLELHLHRDNPRLSAFEIERLHRKAEQNIREALAPFGYYEPQVKANLAHTGEDFTASYEITVGDPVRISMIELAVVGPGKDQFPNLFKQFPLKVGDILNQQQYEDAKKKITIAAMRRGYMQAGFVVRELRIHRAEKRAEIHLTLDTGPQFVFGETRFSDGEVNHELLQRYRPFEPGDPYRPGKLIELQRLLYGSEYFGRVTVDSQLDEVADNTVPVSVDLTPPEHLNRYSIGLGYATDTGARIRLEWKNRLLNPLGHQIRTSAQLSQYDSNVLVDYAIPWLDPKIDTFGLNLGYHEQTWDDTDTNLFAAGVKLDRKGELLRHGGSFEFRSEDYTVGVTSGSSVLFVPTYTGNLILADNLLSTTYGLDVSLSVSGASEFFASDATYLKAQTNGKAILTLVPGLRLIGRGSLGAIWVDSIDDLPPSLRFYAGGDQSIRGYGYRELGTEDASGAVVGGRYLVVASGELEKSITESWSCAAFWDVGNAIDDFSLELEQGVGAGVRYRLPFGQVKLDVASAVSEDGMPFRVHLTVGADL